MIRLLTLVLIVSTLSIIAPQSATAATVTATGTDASFCNQTVDVTTGVTAERLANGDCVVKFSTASTNISWTVPTGVTSVNLLVVAGGGGGGSRHAGGGGGGGVLYVTNYSVTPSNSVALRVGAGGSGAAGGANSGGGREGDNSYFGGASGGTSIVATGGGVGGSGFTASGSGGSSGGSNHQDSASGSATPGSAGGIARTPVAPTSLVINGVTATVNAYGTRGGIGLGPTCYGSDGKTGWCGGGGGGAGSDGSPPALVANPQYKAGNGGSGISNSITGTSTTYGGGGGGGSGGDFQRYSSTTVCANNSPQAGTGGSGGGGNGGVCANTASPGTPNTGGGGGGGGLYYVTTTSYTNGPGGAGGSGIVVVSYTPAAGSQTITRTSTSPVSPVVAGTYTPTATASSGLSVAITIASGSSSICSISIGVVTFNALGSCLIQYNQAGNASYTAATQVSETLTIGKATPTFSAWSNVSKTFGDSTFTVTAPTVTGALAGSFTYSSATTSVISIFGTTLTVAGAGTSVITATFTPTDTTNYNTATTTMTVTVSAATQSITWAPTTALETTASPATPTALATALGSATITYAVASAGTTNCSVNSSTAVLTFTAAGSCTIRASAASTANYAAATKDVTFVITQATRTITVTQGENGTISPSTTSVNYGSNQLFTFTPATGYVVASITVNGSALSGTALTNAIADGYTFSNVILAGTLSATYSLSNLTATFNSNFGTPTTSTQTIPYSTATALTTNTFSRTGFTFAGWTANADGTGAAYTDGQSVTITAATTYYAKWTQNSLYGLTDLLLFATLTVADGFSDSVTRDNGTSGVVLSYPSNSLANGTVISVHLVGKSTRTENILGADKNYVISIAVSWITPAGITPDITGTPISVTLTNNSIKKGAKTYAIINGVAEPLGTATEDGTITVLLTKDPEVVVVTTKPDAPTAVTATSNGNAQSVISWSAPAVDGGSAITGYTVKSGGNTVCETTTALTCTVTGLNNATIYSFTVTATNDVGTSDASAAALAATGTVTTTFTLSGSTITNSAFEGRSVAAVITNIPSGGSYTYQWFGGSDTSALTAISLATSSSYTPKAADRSLSTQMYLAVRVVATISGNTYTFNSTATPVYTYPNANGGSVTAPTPASRGTYTSGKYKVGQTVIGHAWAVMGTPWPTLTYQWWICNTSALTANPQAAAALATPTCQMATGDGNNGVATRGGYVASNPSSIQSTNPDDLGGYGFTYVVPSEAAGKFLTFTATLANAATTAQGSAFTFTQRRTMNSGVIQSTPGISGTPTITGLLKVNRTLTAATVTATTVNSNATGKISYQWQRCTSVGVSCTTYTNIPSATSRYYRTSSSDLNRYLRVVATATNNATTPDTTTASSTTSAVIGS
jgi:uncharacterized repeat protein (TIGR02543 family)